MKIIDYLKQNGELAKDNKIKRMSEESYVSNRLKGTYLKSKGRNKRKETTSLKQKQHLNKHKT